MSKFVRRAVAVRSLNLERLRSGRQCCAKIPEPLCRWVHEAVGYGTEVQDLHLVDKFMG
jgi:hypothetical protein